MYLVTWTRRNGSKSTQEAKSLWAALCFRLQLSRLSTVVDVDIREALI